MDRAKTEVAMRLKRLEPWLPAILIVAGAHLVFALIVWFVLVSSTAVPMPPGAANPLPPSKIPKQKRVWRSPAEFLPGFKAPTQVSEPVPTQLAQSPPPALTDTESKTQRPTAAQVQLHQIQPGVSLPPTVKNPRPARSQSILISPLQITPEQASTLTLLNLVEQQEVKLDTQTQKALEELHEALQSQLMAHWKTPELDPGLNEKDCQCQIQLSIQRDGAVTDVIEEVPARFAPLNASVRAAMAQVKSTNQPLPERFPRSSYELKVTFHLEP
jgi:TonB C terminal